MCRPVYTQIQPVWCQHRTLVPVHIVAVCCRAQSCGMKTMDLPDDMQAASYNNAHKHRRIVLNQQQEGHSLTVL